MSADTIICDIIFLPTKSLRWSSLSTLEQFVFIIPGFSFFFPCSVVRANYSTPNRDAREMTISITVPAFALFGELSRFCLADRYSPIGAPVGFLLYLVEANGGPGCPRFSHF